jgi:glycine oxidase
MSDVVVVGAGVAGMLSALELHDRGHSVRLLDAGQTRPPASWAAGGILSPLFPWRYPAELLPLARHARRDYALWRTRILAAGGVDIEISDGGMLVLAGSEQQLACDWGRANEIAVEAVVASSQMPWLAQQPAVFLPQVARVRNPRILKGLSELIRQSTVQHLQGQVESIESSDSGVQLQTSAGPLFAEQVLIAAGAWSQSLSP